MPVLLKGERKQKDDFKSKISDFKYGKEKRTDQNGGGE